MKVFVSKKSVFAMIVGSSLPAFAFTIITVKGKPTRWKERVVEYTFDSAGSDNFKNSCDQSGPCVSEKDAVRSAFKSWQNVSGANITFSENAEKSFKTTGYDNENTIVWIEKGWRDQSFTPPSGALAVTISTYNTSDGRMRDSDIHFNGEDFQWANIDTSEEKSSNFVDVQNIATHEIGHFFGLDHSSEDIYESQTDLFMATMFFASGPGEVFRRDLKEDDVKALKYLYPSQDVDYPIVDGVTPGTWDARNNPTAILEVDGERFGDTTSVMLSAGAGADIPGRVISNNGKKIQVMFDLYKAPSAKYALLVSNSADTIEKANDAVEVISYGNSFGDNADPDSETRLSAASNSGCAASGTQSALENLILFALIFLVLVPKKDPTTDTAPNGILKSPNETVST